MEGEGNCPSLRLTNLNDDGVINLHMIGFKSIFQYSIYNNTIMWHQAKSVLAYYGLVKPKETPTSFLLDLAVSPDSRK